jgi:hypothetical protein
LQELVEPKRSELECGHAKEEQRTAKKAEEEGVCFKGVGGCQERARGKQPCNCCDHPNLVPCCEEFALLLPLGRNQCRIDGTHSVA